MGIRGKTPRKGGDGGGYWRWLKVRPGQTGEGWIAGDIHAYPAHMGRPSIVCEKTLTCGRNPCHLCGTKACDRDLGYLPIYRADNVPCVLIIHEYSFDQVSRLPFLTHISYGRLGDDDAEAVFVQPVLRPVKYETSLPERRKPQDISVATARYWRRPDLLPDLVKWFRGEVTIDESPPAELVNRVAEHRAQQSAGAGGHKREPLVGVDGNPLPPLLSDVTKEVLRKNRLAAKNPPPNGVHG